MSHLLIMIVIFAALCENILGIELLENKAEVFYYFYYINWHAQLAACIQ